MINNKQVNLWRGDSTPPTIYHIWVNNNNQILLYSEDTKEWKVFIDQDYTVTVINKLLDRIQKVEEFKVNGYAISSNPTIQDKDIPVSTTGQFLKSNIADTLKEINNQLLTQIIE